MALIYAVACLWAILDVAATCVLLARGQHWEYFLEMIRDKSFTATGYDFLLLALLRAAVLIGATIGILCNKAKGPKRAESSSTFLYSSGVVVAMYLCVKLLIFSEQDEFMSGGADRNWFWVILAWTLVATVLNCVVFSKLANASQKPTTVEVDANNITVDEKSPLLKDGKGQASVSINRSGDVGASTSSDDTSSDSDEDDGDDKDSSKKKKPKFSRLTIIKMLSYSKPDFWLIGLAVIFLFGAAIAEIFIPLFTGMVISGIAIEQDSAKFTKNIIIMALITIGASVCAGCRGGIMKVAISRFNMRIRNHLFSSLTEQEIGFFDTNKTGDTLSRLTSDTSTMSDTIGLNCNIFLRSVVKGIGTCVFMFTLSWRLSLVTFMGLPLVVGVSKLYGNYYKKLQTQVQDAYAKANEVAEEVCSSMKTVRSFANEKGEKARYAEKMLTVYKVQLKQALAYAGFMWSTEISALALVTGTLWYGGHLVMNDLMKAQNLISFVLYQFSLGESLVSIGSVYTGLMQALGAAEKVFKLIDREPKIELEKGDYTPDSFEGCVQFDNVTFSYPSRPDQNVLKNVSFIAPPGQVTALVGPSGGGKSSCVNLLQHFYETATGSILIDGVPVEKYCHRYLHQKLSLVGQEPVLYARSVKENIAYGLEEEEYVMADVVEAARKANAHTFITELGKQYETETGEKGTQLSGGQKQRVAIARALIRNPKILVLDEATSALDTESEYLVQQALQKTLKDRTVIVIAHRLSTVETADKIVVVNKGEVVEQGTHAELMQSSGMYYKLVYRQLHGMEKHRNKPQKEKGKKKTSKPNSIPKPTSDADGYISPLSRSLSSSIGSERSLSLHSADEGDSDTKA